jgi:hypothetical protein
VVRAPACGSPQYAGYPCSSHGTITFWRFVLRPLSPVRQCVLRPRLVSIALIRATVPDSSAATSLILANACDDPLLIMFALYSTPCCPMWVGDCELAAGLAGLEAWRREERGRTRARTLMARGGLSARRSPSFSLARTSQQAYACDCNETRNLVASDLPDSHRLPPIRQSTLPSPRRHRPSPPFPPTCDSRSCAPSVHSHPSPRHTADSDVRSDGR